MNEKKIRFMIVDDEPIAHRIIEEYCSGLPHLELVNHSYNAMEAMQFLSTEHVDLMFLDINMPKLRGFDFLKTLVVRPQVIVTTAYQEFALEGFELNVCDYLLKPFPFDRFLTAVNKATSELTQQANQPNHEHNETTQNMSSNERIFIKGDKAHHQIALNNIKYIEACGNYCLVYCDDKKLITHQKISQFESELPISMFMRVHKSFIVAKDKIDSVTKAQINIGKSEIPIGQTYRQKITQLIS